MIRKLHQLADPHAPAAAAVTALSPAAEGATPPAGHGGHHGTAVDHSPPHPALTHAATGFPAVHAAATATILPHGVTVLTLAPTARPLTTHLVADATVGAVAPASAVALRVPAATPDVHPALLSIGGAIGLWAGIGAICSPHLTGTDLTEAGPGARNVMPSVSVKQRKRIYWTLPKQMLPGF